MNWHIIITRLTDRDGCLTPPNDRAIGMSRLQSMPVEQNVNPLLDAPLRWLGNPAGVAECKMFPQIHS